jgi:hypothetical protein
MIGLLIFLWCLLSLVFFFIILEQPRIKMMNLKIYYFLILTKLHIFVWKERLYVETLITDGDTKYKCNRGNKEYRVLKTSLLFPESCYLDIYKNDKFVKRINNAYKLWNYLEKQELKGWIPDNVLKKPEWWVKNKINLVRQVKLERIIE